MPNIAGRACESSWPTAWPSRRRHVHLATCHARRDRPGATPTVSRATAGSRPAPVPSRRPSLGRCFSGGPTRDVFRTTHVGSNQTAGPTAWPNRIYANFVAKTAPTGGFSISNGVGSRLLEPILTQTAHFLVRQQRLKSLNHHPQWCVGNFGENYHAETIHYSRCGQKPCALTTRRSRSVRSRRLVAGRCSEQLGTKRAARRILMRRHGARRNLGLLRNSLAGWSALRATRAAG